MRHTTQFIKVDEKDRVVGALTSAVESGFTNALKLHTKTQAAVLCVRIEKAGLEEILGAPPQAKCALESRYQSGLHGGILFIVGLADLVRLGELVSGSEVRGRSALDAELMDSCLHLFAQAVEDSNKSFTEQHGGTSSGAPELINPDGNVESLSPLSESYKSALCACYQVKIDPQLDVSLNMLIQPELIKSLQALLPDYPVSAPGKSTVGLQDGTRSQPTNAQPLADQFADINSSRIFQRDSLKAPAKWNIDLLLDVELPVSVSFGETEMLLKDVLKLGVGSVIEMDKSVNDPVTVIVNHKTIAKGEVVMVEGNYGVRILEIDSTADRIRSLG